MTHVNQTRSADGSSSKASVEYRFSPEFEEFLATHELSLIVSTYQAGQLVMIGTHGGEIVVDFEPFDRPMGLAYSPNWIAVATRQQMWFLVAHHSIASELAPNHRYQKAFLARKSTWTGDVQAHELGWAGDEIIFVNTSFSCLCKLHNEFSFIPEWRPPFISGLASEDRCHLNGVAFADGEPLFVTAMSRTDSPAGWRANKLSSGELLSVPDGETVLGGLCMPHSPRIHAGEVWLLNSGAGQLLKIQPESGVAEVVATLPGYTRGLAMFGAYGLIGLSKIRETAVFGGVPISKQYDSLKCGLAIIELATGKMVGNFEFLSGVEEIFDLIIVPKTRALALAGPSPTPENPTIWIVPQAGT